MTTAPRQSGSPPADTAWPGGLTPAQVIPVAQALLAGVAAIGASYAVAGSSPAFVVAPVAALVVALTPDVVVTLSITLLGDAGKLLGLATALALTAGLLGAAAFPWVWLARDRAAVGGLLGGAVVAVLSWLVTEVPESAVAAGAGAALVVALPHVVTAGSEDHGSEDAAGRRRLLTAVGAAVGTGLLGLAVAPGSEASDGPAATDDAGVSDDSGSEVGRKLALAEERSLDVDGLEGLVSSSFYTVDVAQFDPKVETGDWSLSVTGAVESERTYDFADVESREYEHRFETLRCVGEKLNGHKCDTALWSGVPLWDLVEPANPQGKYVMLRAADDYFEEFPVEAMRDGLLAVGMNGAGLPRQHGAPARALIPGHWGEINVKWITEIEILDRPAKGYWERRGWHGTGPVNTVAKLWVENRLSDGRVEVAGHAYAGTRGVSRVEVSTDGGKTWTDATLSERLPGDDVWRQWVHRYDPPAEAHEVVVRAVDDDGRVQPEERREAFPSGPTGWVSTTVQP